MKTIVKEVSLDLWICNHFKVLPTEERFKKLTPNQKALLYTGWVELPTSDQIKKFYDSKDTDPVITKSDETNFKALGYTPAQLKRMKEQLENAGYNQQN